MESVFDDLGDDLGGLEADLAFLSSDLWRELPSSSEDEQAAEADDVWWASAGSNDAEKFVTGLSSWWFQNLPGVPAIPDKVELLPNWDAVRAYLVKLGPGTDICEFCGGEARTTAVAIRRRLRTGINFDLVTCLDLGDPETQKKALKYLDEEEVLVLVMAPTCRSLGLRSNQNAIRNSDTWWRHYMQDRPHLRFCGEAAYHHIKKKRFFFCEQPFYTWLWYEPPWPQVLQHPSAVMVRIDQCRLNQRDSQGFLVKNQQFYSRMTRIYFTTSRI